MSTKINSILLVISMLLVTSLTQAQERLIKGIVTTFDSIALVDAEIENRSTKEIVYSDSLGRFQIMSEPGEKLRFKAQGFFNEKAKLEEKTKYVAVNLRMKPGPKNREYAIGYATVTDRDKLNALSSMNNEDADFSQYSNIYDLIRGRFAGVQVKNSEIIIRGVNSINSSSAALIVVDGVPVDGSALNSIPPVQVKSINVIKDGSAAIYGSRGGNGVVIIETRRGDD
jgi:TonB-dependent SusC/RagA subfamily outer membrane receptor